MFLNERKEMKEALIHDANSNMCLMNNINDQNPLRWPYSSAFHFIEIKKKEMWTKEIGNCLHSSCTFHWFVKVEHIWIVILSLKIHWHQHIQFYVWIAFIQDMWNINHLFRLVRAFGLCVCLSVWIWLPSSNRPHRCARIFIVLWPSALFYGKCHMNNISVENAVNNHNNSKTFIILAPLPLHIFSFSSLSLCKIRIIAPGTKMATNRHYDFLCFVVVMSNCRTMMTKSREQIERIKKHEDEFEMVISDDIYDICSFS